jgi:signal transduction histidine kinase
VNQLNLQSRLFLSHLLVAIVGGLSSSIVGTVLAPDFFVVHLERLAGTHSLSLGELTPLLAAFKSAWDQSTFQSGCVGALAAAGLSYWVARRLVSLLLEMEEITQEFALGRIDRRMPSSDIPELNRLAASFNQMATVLEGVEQRRREIVTDLTHELRTPLTVIRGNLEKLADGAIAPSASIYRRSIAETRRLERLVRDLQDLSKAEAGYLPVDLQAVDLRGLLESLVEKFSEQLVEEPLSLALECPVELPNVLADPDRLEQVLVNLIGNAMSYTERGSITLRAWCESSSIWVAVADTGEGIAPDELGHVFERFWRSPKARERHSRGTGIGLAICRRSIELQGGEIFVESELGVGSQFKFYLKAAQTPAGRDEVTPYRPSTV